MAEEKKKENFFKNMLKSIKDFDKYEDFALETPGKAMKYLLKLVAVLCIILCLAYTYKTLNGVEKLYKELKEKAPEFSYKDGTLDASETKILEDYADTIGIVIIDTNVELEDINNTYSENINKYGSGFVFTKNNLVIYNPNIKEPIKYNYSDMLKTYNLTEFTKQDIVAQAESINIISISISIYVVMYIYLFMIYFISVMIDVLILTLLAYVISRCSRIKLKGAPAFGIAVHAITLPVILNLIYTVVNLLTNFEVKYFDIMYNTIACIYVIVAILMIKTDFINRQAELIKIAQEQMKVREELKKQEEEKKEETKKDNKKEEKPEKEKKDKKEKEEEQTDKPLGDATCRNNEQ